MLQLSPLKVANATTRRSGRSTRSSHHEHEQTTAILSAAIALAFGAPAAQAQTVTIKFSHFLASNSNFHQGVAEPLVRRDRQGLGRQAQVPALPGAAARRHPGAAGRPGQEWRRRRGLDLAELLDRPLPAHRGARAALHPATEQPGRHACHVGLHAEVRHGGLQGLQGARRLQRLQRRHQHREQAHHVA